MLRKFDYVERVKSTGFDMLEPDFKLPERSTENSGAYDFFAMADVVLQPREITYIATGVKAKMMNDEILILANRSSNPKKKGIVLSSGINIIDADYYSNPGNDGEIFLIIQNITDKPIEIKKGDKTVQGFFVKFLKTDDDNAKGQRTGGFGSTGK